MQRTITSFQRPSKGGALSPVEEDAANDKRHRESDTPPRRRPAALVRLLASELIHDPRDVHRILHSSDEPRLSSVASVGTSPPHARNEKRTTTTTINRSSSSSSRNKLKDEDKKGKICGSSQGDSGGMEEKQGKACPICSQVFDGGDEFDRHVQREMDELDSVDHANGWEGYLWATAGAVSETGREGFGRREREDIRSYGACEPSTASEPPERGMPRPIGPSNPASECDAKNGGKVMVLGGRPRVAVPEDPRRFVRNKERLLASRNRSNAYWQSLKRKVGTEYNHYADTTAFVDCEDIGLEVHENVGMGWEGMGTSTL